VTEIDEINDVARRRCAKRVGDVIASWLVAKR
jgi:hypothetical protein